MSLTYHHILHVHYNNGGSKIVRYESDEADPAFWERHYSQINPEAWYVTCINIYTTKDD